MKILITGGAGFIGSNLIERLLELEHEVVCIDNFDDFYPKSIKIKNLESFNSNTNYSFIELNILDKKDLDTLFANNNFDVVIHLAAKSGVRPSLLNPEIYFQTNVLGTLNILETMKKFNVKKMIYASSSSVYGNNVKVPFSETDDVNNPISPYAASKKAAELICHTFHHLYNFDIFCLRFFTVYGPKQRPDLAIHKFTNAILNDKEIEMFGNGETSRDYTYIDDILDGIINSIEKLKGFEIINLGESKQISLKTMIKTLEKSIKKQAKIKILSKQAGDVDITFADISKAKKILLYEPKWNFEDGINQFIKWKLKNNLK
jgi:UDP-glucuronate 4-epimerase